MSHILNLWKKNRKTDTKLNSNCCGCSACASKCPVNAISMQYDEEGFLYPKVDESKCVSCGLCLTTCPIENGDNLDNPYIKTLAGYSLNSDILMRGTSGGFVTALSLKIIEKGGVVAGVRYSDDFVKTQYYLARTKDEVLTFSNSKYVQSEKREIYCGIVQELKQGNTVLFVGCPCDVYALKLYLGQDYDMLLTCELVCMGVSSYRIAEDYKKIAEKKNKSQLIKINARSKRKGWFVPRLEEEYSNGKIRCHTLYGTYLGYGMQVYNRPSCFECKFRGTNGVGDIRVGDFWGIKDTDPYWNPNGVSCIFLRTKVGIEILKLLDVTEFALYETDYNTATLSNMSSYKNKSDKFVQLRSKFSKIYKQKGLIAACRATGTKSFWARRLIPDCLHTSVKKIYHKFVDNR